MDASAGSDSRQAIAITAEASAKIAAYAKGDAAWAADLEEAACAIAQQQAMPAVDAAVVKAALLQVWMRERRPPEPPTLASSAPTEVEQAPSEPVATIAPARCEPATAPDDECAQQPMVSAAILSEPRIKAPRFRVFGRSEGEIRLAAALMLITSGLLFLELISLPAPTMPALPASELFDSTRLAEGPPIPSTHPSEDTVQRQRSEKDPAEQPASAPFSAAPERPAVTTGMRSETGATAPSRSVREAQRLLGRLGYRPGPVDGVPGPATAAAVGAFQRDAQFAADGRITPVLLTALRDHARVMARREQARSGAPSSRARSADQPSIVGAWLGSIARALDKTYDSRARPRELMAHCRAVPDDHVFDEATGRLSSCARVVGNGEEPMARHAP